MFVPIAVATDLSICLLNGRPILELIRTYIDHTNPTLVNIAAVAPTPGNHAVPSPATATAIACFSTIPASSFPKTRGPFLCNALQSATAAFISKCSIISSPLLSYKENFHGKPSESFRPPPASWHVTAAVYRRQAYKLVLVTIIVKWFDYATLCNCLAIGGKVPTFPIPCLSVRISHNCIVYIIVHFEVSFLRLVLKLLVFMQHSHSYAFHLRHSFEFIRIGVSALT